MITETIPFFTVIAFWFVLGMSSVCFLLFAYIAIIDARMKLKGLSRPGNLESMAQVGDLAEKFAKSGFGPSAMACSVLFALLATAIALALDKMSIVSIVSFTGPGIGGG